LIAIDPECHARLGTGSCRPGRAQRGRQRRLHARRLVGELLGRPDGPGHGRGDEHAVRNLVDQYRLWVFPLVLGSGKRLFSAGAIPAGLKLVDSKVSTTGVVIGTYEPAGEIVTGSFALD
jgi:RibD C-terminal domain